MNGIKNVMLLAHEPANVPFESYHPPRNSTIEMISGIESNISKSIQVYEIAAHNHFMAKSNEGRLFILTQVVETIMKELVALNGLL
jgi:hypothetical protein